MEDFIQMIPAFGEAIGLEYLGSEGRKVRLRVPYAAHLVGDPDTGVIHGGVITAALDNASGWAVRHTDIWEEGISMATLDLRIDYMRSAIPGRDLLVTAECYKKTQTIAFIRAVAYDQEDEDDEDPVATSVAAFMMGTPNQPRTEV